ncbi:MAG: response regulator transcription factor [Chloroflexi bacterium]|nr:response regulator transcription factor [Chloroflexota bacterium]
MDRIRVLLVDDHAILRDGLRAMLALSDDIQVVGEAADGREALAAIERLAPHVVIMDMAMPGMDGLEATRRIAKQSPQTKVLVLSQHDNERYILPVLQAGAVGYVLKRSVGAELVTAIRTVCRGECFVPPSIAKVLLANYREREQPELPEDGPGLTEREKEVLKLVAEGRTSQEIAELLSLSKKTVMCHRANIYQKLGTHNRTELIKCAVRFGLIELNSS